VRRGSAAYERELKDLLQGNREALRRYARRLPPTERSGVERHAERPFLVVRAAGSFGFDLVALRPEFAFPLEVKASGSETIRFSASSARADQQLKEHRAAVGRVGLLVVYAYRRVGIRSGDAWRLFVAGGGSGRGSLEVLRKRLPSVEATENGAGVLRWEHGLPLTRFLEVVAFLTDRAGSVAA